MAIASLEAKSYGLCFKLSSKHKKLRLKTEKSMCKVG